MSDDMSDDSGKPTATITTAEVQQEINDKIQERHFRTVAFYGACSFVVLFMAALLFWLVLWPLYSFDLHKFAGGIDPDKYANLLSQTKTLWTLGIIVLAAIPTTLALALLRFAFSSKNQDTKESDVPGVWLSLAKEIADVIKQYINRKP